MASFLRKEIQAAVREEISRVISSSTDSIPTTTATTRSSTAETRTGVGRDSPSTSTSSTEEQTLSFGEFYALREKERQGGFVPPKKKMKKQPPGKSAVPGKHMDVEVKVGIASHADGVFKSRRGKMHSIIVKSNAEKGEITRKAIAKHSSFDQTFDGTIPYVLLFPDFSEVNFVPGTNDPFVLSSYKQAISKDYKRLTFFLIPSDEFANRDVDSDDSSNEQCAKEGGLTKWLAGREPKQTNIVGNDDERHVDVLPNIEGEFYDQCQFFLVREAFLLAQNQIEVFVSMNVFYSFIIHEGVNQHKCSLQVASTSL